MEEALAAMFILENLALVGVSGIVLTVRMLRERREKREAAEQNRALDADGKQQIADMREEMTQMREMMADFLLDMQTDRRPPITRETLGEGSNVE